MLRKIFLIAFVYFGNIVSSTDPCQTHKLLTENARAANLKIDLASSYPFSDDRLKLRWYKIVNDVGDEMTTEPPGTFMCSTLYPIWLNGTLPNEVNQTLTRQVCLQTFQGICERSWNIKIKRCPENDYVYELPPSPVIDSGYCFGWADTCANGESSETGKEPGCSSDYPHITLTPFVETLLKESSTINENLGPSLLPIFRCRMNNIDQSYAYDVDWVINGLSVLTFKNKVPDDLLTTDMMPSDWIHLYQMNMQVKCSIRVRNAIRDTPSPKHHSQEFAAGLIIDQDSVQPLQIAEGEEKIIKLKATVPVGCIGKNIQSHCNNILYISQPVDDLGHCSNGLRQDGGLTFERQFCGISIPSTDWNKTFELRVTGYVDSYYNVNTSRMATISLMTITNDQDPSGIWNNFNLQEIKVRITDSDRAFAGRVGLVLDEGSLVSIYNQHYSFQAVGEFLLYRQNDSNFEIHVLKTKSSTGIGVCGVAIRSFDSLFVMRTCSTISQVYIPPSKYFVPEVKYSKCGEDDMTIQQLPWKYTIILPSGTEVTFRHSRHWIHHIVLKPSILDYGQVDGLLGNVPANNQYTFISMHRILDDSQVHLFSESPSFHENTYQRKTYCECKQESGPTQDISYYNEIQCNLTQPSNAIVCDNIENSLDNSVDDDCTVSRKRRNIGSNDIPMTLPLVYDNSIEISSIIQNHEWPTGWTKEKAISNCEDAVFGDSVYNLCARFTQIDTQLLITACVDGIKILGDLYAWSEDSLRDICFTEASRNETLHTIQKSTDESLFDFLMNSICPDDCSGNGACVKGKCLCDDNFMGIACTIRRSIAPNNITVPANGLCKTRQQDCFKTKVYGDFSSSQIYCRLDQIKVFPDGMTKTQNVHIYRAEYDHEYRISCQFPSERRKRSIEELAYGYELSLSYDKVNFGEKVYVVIYDEVCVSCDEVTKQCTDLKRCYTTTTQHPVLTDSTDVTDNIPFEKNKKDHSIPVLTLILCLICILLILGIALICYKNKADQRRRKKVIYAEQYGKQAVHNVVYNVTVQAENYQSSPPPPYSNNWIEHSLDSLLEKKIPERFVAVKY